MCSSTRTPSRRADRPGALTGPERPELVSVDLAAFTPPAKERRLVDRDRVVARVAVEVGFYNYEARQAAGPRRVRRELRGVAPVARSVQGWDHINVKRH